MNRFLLLLAMSTTLLCATEYYAKVEPYEIRTIASNVSGLVLFADEKREGEILGKKPYIVIDDELDAVELEKVKKKIELLHVTMELDASLKSNYETVLERKKENYDKIKDMKIKSSVEKDNEFYNLVTSQNALISTDKEMASLQTQINDLQLRQAQLERSIRDKHLYAEGFVLYALLVKPGQVVVPGTALAKVADVSKGLLTFYLSREDREALDQKVLYINGEKSDYRFNRVWNIADEQHLSSYKAQIVIDAPKQFSSLLKVELRDE